MEPLGLCLERRVAPRRAWSSVPYLRSSRRRAHRTLGIDDHVTAQSFAAALRFKITIVTEGQVKHAALARAHGSKAVGLGCAADPFGGCLRGPLKLPRAGRLEG